MIQYQFQFDTIKQQAANPRFCGCRSEALCYLEYNSQYNSKLNLIFGILVKILQIYIPLALTIISHQLVLLKGLSLVIEIFM